MPVPIEGSEFLLDVDNVIVAAGESPDFSGLGSQLGVKEGRLIVASDGVTLRKGVFAGGDVATGDGTVSEAIASGKKGGLGHPSVPRKGGRRSRRFQTRGREF